MELELREVSDPAAASAFGAVYLSVPLSEPEALFVAGRVAPGLHRVCLLDRTGQIASTTDLPGNHRVNDACRIPAADAVAIAVGEYDGGYLYEGGLLRWDLVTAEVTPILNDCGAVLACAPTLDGGLLVKLSPLDDQELEDFDDDSQSVYDNGGKDDDLLDEVLDEIVEAQRPGGGGVTGEMIQRLHETRSAHYAQLPPWDEGLEIHYEATLGPKKIRKAKPIKLRLDKRIPREGFGEGSITQRRREVADTAHRLVAHTTHRAYPPGEATSLVLAGAARALVGYDNGVLRLWGQSEMLQEWRLMDGGEVRLTQGPRTVLIAATTAGHAFPSPESSRLFSFVDDEPRLLKEFPGHPMHLWPQGEDVIVDIDADRAWRVTLDGVVEPLARERGMTTFSVISVEESGSLSRMVDFPGADQFGVERWERDERREETASARTFTVISRGGTVTTFRTTEEYLRAQADWVHAFSDPVLDMAAASTPYGGLILASTQAGALQIISTETGHLLHSVRLTASQVPTPAISVDIRDDTIAIVSASGPPRFWTIRSAD